MENHTPKKKIFLIRHAQSAFNLANSEVEGEPHQPDFKEKMRQLNCRYDLIDCPITTLGMKQAKEGARRVNDINIRVILASPMRRALQTAHEVFREHPNKIKVIAVPELKEALGASCDITDDPDKLQAEFPECDFSLLNKFPEKRLWYLYVLKDEELKKSLLDEIYSKYPDKEEAVKKAADVVISRISSTFPHTLEKTENVYKRVKEVKRWIYEKAGEVGKDEEVAIVAHSVSLQCFNAKDIDKDGNLIGEKFLENCEVLEYNE